MNKVKKLLNYAVYYPLIYSEELRDAYLDASICGGRLKEKNVLITGATGEIGVAIALRYIKEDCNLILADGSQKKLEETKEYLQRKTGSNRIEYLVIEQSDENSIELAVKQLEERDEFIDILVNNAGIFTDVDKKRIFRTVSEEKFMDVWKTNYEGVTRLSRLVADGMKKRKIEGCIVNVASICAKFKNYQYTPYGMSKAAIIKFTQEMRRDYAPISCICIAPGSVVTTMGNLSVVDNIAKGCNVLHHPALPEEIAAQVVFFSSGFGRYITKEVVASACETL